MSEALIIAIAIICQANSPNSRFIHSAEKLQKQQAECFKQELVNLKEYNNILTKTLEVKGD